jgi:hypothetical protein
LHFFWVIRSETWNGSRAFTFIAALGAARRSSLEFEAKPDGSTMMTLGERRIIIHRP